MTHGATLQNLLPFLLCHTTIDLLPKNGSYAEERRIFWDLVELGFDHLIDGKVILPQEQMCKIVNILEICSIFAGSKNRKCGRPAVTFYNLNFSELRK